MSNLSVPSSNPALEAHIKSQIYDVNGGFDQSIMDHEKISTVKLAFDQTVKMQGKIERDTKIEFDEARGEDVFIDIVKREYTVMFPQLDSARVRSEGYVARNEVPMEKWIINNMDKVTPFVTKYTHTQSTKEGGEDGATSTTEVKESMTNKSTWNFSARVEAAQAFFASLFEVIKDQFMRLAYRVMQTAGNVFGRQASFQEKIDELTQKIRLAETSLSQSLSAMRDPVSVLSSINEQIQKGETPSLLVKRENLAWGTEYQSNHGDASAVAQEAPAT